MALKLIGLNYFWKRTIIKELLFYSGNIYFVKMNLSLSVDSWTTTIHARPLGKLFDFKEVYQYRDLLRMFVKRDVVTFYKQTILGPLWFLLQPLFTTLIFWFVFGRLAQLSTDTLPQPLFYMAGIVCWNYFSECLNRISSTFTTNSALFGKVYFPRIVIPLSVVISNLVKMAIQWLLFALIYLLYLGRGFAVGVTPYLLLFPLLIVIMAGLSLGFGLLFTSLTSKYRDLVFLLTFGVQLWMYATPIIYPLSSISLKYRYLMILNPMTSVVETVRLGLLGVGTFSWSYLLYSVVFTLLLLVLGVFLFGRVQRNFMDFV